MQDIVNSDTIVIISIHADPSMPPGISEWGGTHSYIKELIVGLASKGRHCTIITRKSFVNLCDHEVVSDYCDIYRESIGPDGPIDKKKLYELHPKSKVTISRIIKDLKRNPTILHSVYWNSGHVAMELSIEFNIPFVHSVISNSIGRKIKGAHESLDDRDTIEKRVFHNAHQIFCITDAEKKELIEYYNVSENKIVVIGRPVNVAFLFPSHNNYGQPRRKNLSDSVPSYIDIKCNTSIYSPEVHDWWHKRVFSYVGRIAPNKGVEYIIKAWHILYRMYPHTCPPLWIVGGTPDEICGLRHLLRNAAIDIQSLEESGRLSWWGYLDEAGVSTIYLKSLALVTHSQFEPGGRVILEAMSSGLPVISTDTGFAKDLVRDWLNGFIVPYGDIIYLSRRMEHFIHQPLLRYALGYAARQIATSALTAWNFIDTHCIIYDNVINNNPIVLTHTYSHHLLTNSAYDAYKHRFIDCFPCINNMPSLQENVAKFVDSFFNNHAAQINPLDDIEGSSYCWAVKTNCGKYIVKHPYTRFSMKAIWDPFGQDEHIHDGDHRFTAELSSKGLPGLVPIIAYDINTRLLLFPYIEKPPISLADNYIPEYISPLRALYDYKLYNEDVLTFFKSIDHSWDKASIKDIFAAKSNYKNLILGKSLNWNTLSRFSLRVSLRELECRLLHHYNRLSKQETDMLIKQVHQLAVIANNESHVPIVLCHGSAEINHIVCESESNYLLIDSERIHPAWHGEDIASMLISIANNFPENNIKWEYLLETATCDDQERQLVVTWIGFLTIQEMFKNAILIDYEKNAVLSQRLSVIMECVATL